ncbi:MAG TPA: CHAT domain-containing tetratricopeptide repeat protein [Pyrinomonadaceae bacterium]|nr:CHAT domain-containing tetratricopeptide repeat protein [Pyrinomonadaceae bacterium]
MAGQETAARGQAEIPALAIGRPVEGKMDGGETRLFRAELAAGEYLRAVVEQKGIDLAVALVGPDKKRLMEIDSPNGEYGPEPVSTVAERAGEYLIEVRSLDKKARPGLFEIRLEARREPTPADRSRARAERAFAEASPLVFQSAAQPRREAIEKLEAILPVFRSLEDRAMEALTLNTVAIGYHFSGHLPQALRYYEQALPISKALNDSRGEARLLNNIGGVYDILGDPQKALDYYARALPLWQSSGPGSGQGDTLNNIGVIYYNLGDLQRALDYYNRALPLRRAGDSRRKEADTLDNIGRAYTALGETGQALEHLQHALGLRRGAKDVQGEANSLDQLGFAYAARGETAKALGYYEQALPLRRAAGDRRGEARTLNNLGAAYAAQGEPQKAGAHLAQSLELYRAVGDRREEAFVLVYLGKVHALQNQPQKAVEYYEQALALFRALGDRRAEAWAHQGIALAERDRGNLVQARAGIEAAVNLIEALRAQVLSQQLRASFFASKQDAYELYVDVLMRSHRLDPSRGDDAAALEVSERARARSLLEMMSEFSVDIRQGVDPSLLERERTLSQLLNAKSERLMRLLGQKNTEAQAAALKKEIGALEEDYQRAQGDIRQRSPRYAAITQPRPLGPREIQQLLDPDTLLLEYSLGQTRSYLWAVGQNSLKSYELAGRDEIEQTARQLYDLVTARSLRKKGESADARRERISRADSEARAAAAKLSRLVLGPVASELGNKRLVIVTDGTLQYIPFAMLPVPKDDRQSPAIDDYRPLIVEHEIVSLPSASTLAVQRKELAGRKPAPKAVAVVADPVFEGADARVKSRSRKGERPPADKTEDLAGTRILEHLGEQEAGAINRPRIPRLPYTRREAEQILAVAPGPASFRAVDFKANIRTALGGELSQYRYVHFATHGYIDSERPGLSAVVLSLVNERGEQQDGFLKTREIYNLNLPAELVVLSACQTGLGKEIKGEGLVGLTRGFMYAGAARVVVSMWNVSDRGTADLMARLYRGMIKDGQRPSAALRAAQLEMWKQKQWESPYYWAAFVQQGDWR